MALKDPCQTSRLLELREASQVGAARRLALAMAHGLGFSAEDAGRAALVAHEMASNTVRHGDGGHLLLRESGLPSGSELELLALDSGPGIARLDESLRDGTSTAGTPGTGLGAITRMSDAWDLWTAPTRGVALVARIRDRGRPAPKPAWSIGAVTLPVDESGVSGDCWIALPESRGRMRLMVADGLGHGPDAHVAALAAARIVLAAPAEGGPGDLLSRAWDALRPTRGAAVTLIEIDPGLSRLISAGVGNVNAVVLAGDGSRRNIVNVNGIVGQGPARVREYALEWFPGSTLVACSDGITSRWTHDAYGAILARDPALLAGLIWRDHARGRDDATVVVVRTVSRQ